MKPSHLTTPRSLGECNFTTGYVSAPVRTDRADRIVVWGCVVAALACMLIVLFYPEVR